MQGALRHDEAGARRVEGAEAFVGSSSSATRPRIAQKPARMSGWMHDSVPPARTASAAPRRISSAPSPTACEPVARGRRGVVRPAQAERDRDLPARRVDQHARDEEGRDPVRAAVAQDVLLHDPRQPADRRADDDADAVGISVQAAVAPGLRAPRRARAGRFCPSGAPPSPARPWPGRSHFAGDPDRVLARVERLDEVDAALARDGRLPRRARVETERRDRAQPGDGDLRIRPSYAAASSPRSSGCSPRCSRPTRPPDAATASRRDPSARRAAWPSPPPRPGSAARPRRSPRRPPRDPLE